MDFGVQGTPNPEILYMSVYGVGMQFMFKVTEEIYIHMT